MRKPRSFVIGFLVAALCGAAMAPGAAYAWGHGGWGWRGGVFFGFAPPVYVGPPMIYAGPPVVYPPPVYAPPPYAPAPAGQACYAGAYVCPLDQPGPIGARCSCPTNTGRAGGQIR
jgi:hypothetical protein